MEQDSDDETRIIETFFRMHEEVYPLDADSRAKLRDEKMDRLEGDAAALLAYGASVETICSIIERDMRKRPGLHMTAPWTIRFCCRSIEKLAKIGGSFGKRERRDRGAVDIASCAAAMSLGDRERINKKVVDEGFATLTAEERWRWYAYVRAWRELKRMSGPPPFDSKDEWLEPTLHKIATDLLAPRMRRGSGPSRFSAIDA